MAIGDPVAAEDKDGDVLTYTLVDPNLDADTNPEDSFDIDWATGQLKTKSPLNFEGDNEPATSVTVQGDRPGGRTP